MKTTRSRACTAALALHDAFNRLTSLPGGERGPRLVLRVGLASSDVVLRSASNDLYQEYTALGPAVRVATRLGQVAAAGTTLLTSETLRAAEGYIRARPVGSLSAVGQFSAVEAFELIGWQPTRTRFQRVVTTRQLTRFVGRDSELAALALALGRAGDGHGQTVALVGDPGVGKSRLIWEATRSARAEGWVILESGAVSHGTVSSYQPAIDLVKSYCRIEARDDGPSVREKVTGRILALDRPCGPAGPAGAARRVRRRCCLGRPGSSPGAGTGPWLPFKRLLLRQSQEAPLLLAFEDLHWIDGETQALLDILVDSLPAARVLLLAAYRPEYAHAWFRRTYYTQLRVDALPTQRADELLGALVGDDAALRSLKQHLIAKSEGNPLFLEESVRSLVEGGALVGERGAYRQARPIDTIQVPESVQTVLMARIDRLDPDAKRLLQTAAVIGKDVPFALLRAIVEGPDQELHGALTHLLATELRMYEADLFPELVYTFKHALTHEVAYDSLLHDQRRALHARIVDAIEATEHDEERGPDRVAKQADRWAIMPCGATSGRRPSPTGRAGAAETARAPRIARRPRIFSRRSKS